MSLDGAASVQNCTPVIGRFKSRIWEGAGILSGGSGSGWGNLGGGSSGGPHYDDARGGAASTDERERSCSNTVYHESFVTQEPNFQIRSWVNGGRDLARRSQE
jgi:hypothetical protein